MGPTTLCHRLVYQQEMDKSLFFSLQNQLDSRWDNIFAHNSSSQYLLLLLCSLRIAELCFSSPAFQAKAQKGLLASAAALSCSHACAVGQAGHPHTSQPWIIWILSGGRDHPYPSPWPFTICHCGCKPCSSKSVNLVFCKSLLRRCYEELVFYLEKNVW